MGYLWLWGTTYPLNLNKISSSRRESEKSGKWRITWRERKKK